MFQRLLLLWVGWLCVGSLVADGKFVRLRNEKIETPEKPTRAAVPSVVAPDSRVTGLYLVQFTQRIDPAWRDELSRERVEFLHYVPDDAFLVHLDGASLGSVRSKAYVRWVGPYEPRHKLHARVTSVLARNPGTNLPVKLLVRSGAKPEELAMIRHRVTGFQAMTSPGFGTFVSGRLTARRLAEIAGSPAVVWIEHAPHPKLVDEIAAKLVAGDTGTPGTLARVQALGFDGSGVTVSVADSGLDLGDADLMHPDLAGRVDAFLAYGGLPDASDEHSHGTHCAGIVAGNAATREKDDAGNLYGLGVAPGAHLVAQRIFDGNGDYFPPASNEQLTRDAVRAGALVGSNSWGDDTQGQYDLSAAEFDALVRDADSLTPGEQPYVLEFSAGNAGSGPRTIGSPAVAKNVIATGASENDRLEFGIYASGSEVMADFSSRGPCEDGRIKPDLTAPGTWIASAKSAAAGEDKAWSPIDEYYLYMGGTSQAGPHASGACAVFIQWYRSRHAGATPSPAMVKAGLINSAADMGTALVADPENPDDPGTVVGDTAPVPNMDEGWGRVDLGNLIDSDRRFELTDQDVELSTGQTWEKRVVVGAAEPLKVTLVYTDVPALPAAIPALVNDLDLEAVSPSGQLYRGNAFLGGESIPGTPAGDAINNVEAVHLALPEAGEWILRVRAANVVRDIHRRTGGVPVQDFALVVSGNLPAPGEGVVSLDRGAYRVPATATIRLVDAGLAGRDGVGVRVDSDSMPAGVPVTLARGASPSTFVGTVQLVAGVPGAGQLGVADGDRITVAYVDASPPGEYRATALVDNLPPVVDGVEASSAFGRTSVSCAISEPASVQVWYGTTNAVTNVVSRLGLATQATVALPALDTGTTYFYALVATDRAGNVSTNNNDGHYFRFVGPRVATALLVYSPELIFTDLLAETSYPGPENWTSALDAAGIDYEVWDTAARGGAPTAEQLKAYRLVLWRPEELQGPPPGITAALAAYVANGGALFVASFDLLSRLSEASLQSFATGTLHVASELVDRGANSIVAVHGDPVGAGVRLDLDYDAFPSGIFIDLLGIVWPDGPDHLQLGADAAPVFVQEGGGLVGVRYPKTGVDGKGRVVFLSVAFEAIPADGMAPNNRATVLGNAIGFLVPGLTGLSTLAFDADAYPLPGLVTMELGDPRRAGSNVVSVAVSTTSEPTPRMVPCFETPLRGVFRGQWVLDASGAPAVSPGPVRLGAKNGDTVTASYVDAAGRSIVVDATVDTVAPRLTVPTVEPAYNEVVVSWTTDKACDALVRFGEGPGDDSFLPRSAYVAGRGTEHEVQVTGLLPDRVYYFQIVSRDAAGNTTTGDNAGNLYQWRTLKPLLPPWSDGLEAGIEGWAVYDGSASTGIGGGAGDGEGDGTLTGTNWVHGTPVNAHGVVAHGGTSCWATNLGGDAVDFAITDLVSPALSLVGGNKATLRFWQNYDFTTPAGGDEFGDLTVEAAQLDVTADNGATWNPLYANQAEASDDWELVELDLAKYVGKVVRFRFNYQLFAFTPADRLGWLVDDVSVEMRVAPATVLVVSNNLSQAGFTLRLVGATNEYKGAGLYWRTNLPSGTYAVSWDPVAYHTAPAPQTNVLGTSVEVPVYPGIYRFQDTNGNGISDTWETAYFGGLLQTPPGTDSDGDGASDAAEFLAGTDPRSASSVLQVSEPRELPNRTVRIEWPTMAGRQYLLEGSQDLRTWLAYSEATRADGSPMGVTLPALDPRITYLFRVRVVP